MYMHSDISRQGHRALVGLGLLPLEHQSFDFFVEVIDPPADAGKPGLASLPLAMFVRADVCKCTCMSVHLCL
jgi:hypothetical protein